jgi:NAD(P)-dependent dehydrogenase (short-subunit alcohol dehydrogenase family)
VQGRATNNWPGTIDETAAAVTAAGGGIPVRCDHTVDTEVAALFARVQQEHGRLDVPVNNAWGGNALAIHADPFWELALEHWQHMFTAGVRATIVSSRYAVPLMLPQRQGLIMNISAWDRDKYTGHLLYDLAKQALNRLAYGMAVELRAHHIAVVAIAPGWMRTELVLAAFQTDEEH